MAIVLGRKPGGSGGGGAPSGPAGGSLAGTYPNPSITAGAVDTAEIANGAVDTAQLAADSVDSTIIDGSDAAAIRTLLGVIPSAVLFDSTLGGDAASIDTGAAGIAQTNSTLLVVSVLRTTEAAVTSSALWTLNNDSGANYDHQRLTNANVTVTGGITLAANNWNLLCTGANAQAGAVSPYYFVIPAYAQTTFHKNVLGLNAVLEDTAADATQRFLSMRYRSTTAISRMAVAAGSGNLLAGSRLSIYGIG